MKFALFMHMERMNRSSSHQAAFDDLTSFAQMADRAGFETIWVGEHHAMEFTIAPNPFINLTYLATRTERVRLGTSTLVAPFWHPIRLAGEAAMTDLTTGGRLDICLARGAYSFEYERMAEKGRPIDTASAGRALRELVPTLPKLWAGDYAHDGEFWSFPLSTSVPKPVQQPHPPLWIAARDPSSHEFAVAQGCSVQVTPLWQPDAEIESLMGRFNRACAANPKVERPRIMLLRHTYVAADADDALRAARELSDFYKLFMTWFKNEKPVTDGFMEPPSDAEQIEMAMLDPQVLRDNLVIGTVPEVIERLEYCRALGYDQYAIWLDSGMSVARKQASLRRFVDGVMPAFS